MAVVPSTRENGLSVASQYAKTNSVVLLSAVTLLPPSRLPGVAPQCQQSLQGRASAFQQRRSRFAAYGGERYAGCAAVPEG